MRNLLFASIILIFFFSCKHEIIDGYKIEGRLKNAKAGDVLLFEKLLPTSVLAIDTIKPDADGNFKIKGKLKEPSFFILRQINLNRKSSEKLNFVTLLLNNGEQIFLKADIANLNQSSTIDGDNESASLRNLDSRIKLTLRSIDSLASLYRAGRNKPQFDSISAKLDKAYKKIIFYQKQYSIDFIRNNPHSLATIYALSQQIDPQNYVFKPAEDFAYFKMVFDSLKKYYHQHEQIKNLERFVTDYEQNISNPANQFIRLGGEAPNIALRNPDGLIVSMSSIKGKYVLLEFWASWCTPCRAENPNLLRNYDKYHRKGFEIYQVSLDNDHDQWTDAIKDDNLRWFQVSDLKYWESAAAKLYHVQAIPANYLLDPNGRIIAINLHGDELTKKLDQIFK